ncbi:hypothetical protein D3C78_1421790 [compost metagenome]
MRALSHALAPNMTVFPFTAYSCKSLVSTYETPIAIPSSLVSTSRTMALSITFRFPVFIAGITKQEDEEKSPYTLQARPHCPQ